MAIISSSVNRGAGMLALSLCTLQNLACTYRIHPHMAPSGRKNKEYPFKSAGLSKGAPFEALRSGKPDAKDLMTTGIDARRAELFVGANQAMHGFHKRPLVPRDAYAHVQEARPIADRGIPTVLW